MVLYDPKWYNIITTAIQNSRTIHEIYQKANITHLFCHGTKQSYSITPPKSKERGFRLYLTNQFDSLLHYTDKSKLLIEKIFYYRYLCYNRATIEELCKTTESQSFQNQLIKLLLHKYRCRLATMSYRDSQNEKLTEIKRIIRSLPPKYSNSVKYLEDFMDTMSEKILKMQSLLNKHETRFDYHSNTYYSGDAFSELYQIQAIAYDYYFYFHDNFLPIFYFSDAYVKENGALSSADNKKRFGRDADYPILQSLENYNAQTKTYEKADIFFRRTVSPVKEIKAVSIEWSTK